LGAERAQQEKFEEDKVGIALGDAIDLVHLNFLD